MPQRTKCLLLGLVFASASFAQKYTAQGELISPPDYREWVYLSTGIGMDYSKEPSAHPVFDNVFVNPQAYKAFMKTGSWPDKTMLVKENRASDADPLSNGGKVQTKVVSHEIHVKDASHGGWVFYVFRPGVENAKPFEKQQICTDCHGKNGAVETTFVQYYPTLIETAKQHGTFHDK
jgi:hypothetical protein